MNKKINIIILKLFIILVSEFLLIKNIGILYLKKLNIFIKENNTLLLKKEINHIIRNNLIYYDTNLYKIIYNDNHEIVSIDLNVNKVNEYLSSYIDLIDNSIKSISYDYLGKYYKSFNTSKNKYYLLPLGMISDNPFIFNTGPKVLINYDLINVPVLKIKVNIKNYGLNNALVETYLLVHVDQSVLKPVLSKVSSYDYNFLISSKIINGRISTYLGTNLTTQSDSISTF